MGTHDLLIISNFGYVRWVLLFELACLLVIPFYKFSFCFNIYRFYISLSNLCFFFNSKQNWIKQKKLLRDCFFSRLFFLSFFLRFHCVLCTHTTHTNVNAKWKQKKEKTNTSNEKIDSFCQGFYIWCHIAYTMSHTKVPTKKKKICQLNKIRIVNFKFQSIAVWLEKVGENQNLIAEFTDYRFLFNDSSFS